VLRKASWVLLKSGPASLASEATIVYPSISNGPLVVVVDVPAQIPDLAWDWQRAKAH
jgi:hypothetical protein